MLAWMLYVIVVTALLGAAALAAERGARLRAAPSRWLWIAAIAASLLLPTVVASVSVQLPSIVSPTVSQKVIALREVTSARLSTQSWIASIDPGATNATAMRTNDQLLQRMWTAASGLMVTGLLLCAIHLFRRKRGWAAGSVAGVFVYIAPDAGPAVVGLIRPSIVVPTWLTHASLEEQAVVIAHEQAHLDAGDPQLLTAALCLLVFMPWNLPLWWQLRRLRCAIEVDCDRRVLKTGHDTTDYGKTLIAVAQRQSAYIGAVAAMAESFLERRIQIMVRKPAKWWRLSAAALACVSFGLVVVAAEVGPPNAGEPAGRGHRGIPIEVSVLDGYTGYYRLGQSTSFMTISLDGRQLFEQMNGQPKAEIYADGTTEFFLKVVDAQISFVTDAQGHASALILHQGGVDITMKRIGAGVAHQLTAEIAAKVQSQIPTPGSEAALRRLLTGSLANVSPELTQIIKSQSPRVQPLLTALGAVQSIEFRGVGNSGWDVYDVKYEHGALQWRIALSSSGFVTGAMATALP